jgi:DNA topoisomerase-3
MDMEFDSKYSSWTYVNPIVLFSAEIKKTIPDQHKDVAKTLKNEAKQANELILWLDCDREGNLLT